jgi:HAD superfamily 5'-nucleotidase-like hydrolase
MSRAGRNGRPAVPRPTLPRDEIPATHRIFVNRNLKMSSVRLIGFDMDHTLAVYRPRVFERLAFECARAKLVAERGYPDEVLAFEYDHDFVIRGLVVDKATGNILKMDRHHYVTRAFHGTRPLPKGDRKALYQGRKIPLSSGEYASLDTLFSLPEISLYGQMVDLADRQHRGTGEKPDYRVIYDHVRAAVDEAHADGSIKSVIQADPERYVLPDPELAPTLDKFRQHGKKLFLLTNSEPSYTEVVMGLLLDRTGPGYRSWKDYFDLAVTEARKPGFFIGEEPFRHASSDREGMPIGEGEHPRFVMGGNARDFEARVGFRGDQILYFGDHTYGDILRSKATLGWRTAMIVTELEEEIEARVRAHRFSLRAQNAERGLDRLIADRDLLEIERATLRAKVDAAGAERDELREQLALLKQGLRELDRRISRAERRLEASWDAGEAVYNRNWGPSFKTGNTQTRFGAQVARFACVYTSRVSNFHYYPTRKFYKPHREEMPHERDT